MHIVVGREVYIEALYLVVGIADAAAAAVVVVPCYLVGMGKPVENVSGVCKSL